MNQLINTWRETSLVAQIAIGLVIGVAIALISPESALSLSIFGDLFVAGLKAVAPILVFILVMSAIANHQRGQKTSIKPLISLYLMGTIIAALIALIASTLFPTTLSLSTNDLQISAPTGISQVLQTLLFNIMSNPIDALSTANFIGILAWAIILGMGLQHANDSTKNMIADFAQAITKLVKIVIAFAPIGIMGLVAKTVAETGFSELLNLARLLTVLVGSMLFMALIVNPIIVFIKIKRNPYPLVLKCLKDSGITAFFTRSSAANIPVNLELCEKLNLPKDTYSMSIPLGATVNMAGAAITITTLTLAAAHTVGVQVDLATALLLCVIAAVSACGASGVAGGSLLLIPLACGLFGINSDIAMQVVAIGFIISVVQDSCETALNSSTDVVYTAAACLADEKKS